MYIITCVYELRVKIIRHSTAESLYCNRVLLRKEAGTEEAGTADKFGRECRIHLDAELVYVTPTSSHL